MIHELMEYPVPYARNSSNLKILLKCVVSYLSRGHFEGELDEWLNNPVVPAPAPDGGVALPPGGKATPPSGAGAGTTGLLSHSSSSPSKWPLDRYETTHLRRIFRLDEFLVYGAGYSISSWIMASPQIT